MFFRIYTFSLIVFCAVILCNCVTPKKTAPLPRDAKFHRNFVSETKVKTPEIQNKISEVVTPAPEPSDVTRRVEVCKKVSDRFLKVYKDLLPFHKNYSKQDFFNLEVEQLKSFTEKSCDDRESRQKVQKTLSQLLNRHNYQVCILYKSPVLEQRFLLNGFQKAMELQKISSPIVSDSENRSLEESLAQCVFTHGSAILVSFLSSTDNFKLAGLAEKMQLTTFMANAPESPILTPTLSSPAPAPVPTTEKSRYIFTMMANRSDLAALTVTQAQRKGWSKLALLFPNADGGILKITDFTSDEVLKNSVVASEPYRPGQFDSIDRAVKKILRLDPNQRPEEYRAAFELQKSAKTPLKEPVLAPKINFDALLILDNFRIVRHVVKLLQFYNVHSLPLIGIPDWRGKGLLSPPEKFLEHSFFVDTLPSAAILSRILPESLRSNDEFFPLDRYDEIDFSYQGSLIAHKISPFLTSKPKLDRRKIFSFFSSTWSWPYYIFTVNNEKLVGQPIQK